MTPGYRFGVPPSGGGAHAKTVIVIMITALEGAGVPSAKLVLTAVRGYRD
jgi:hypothetical protein